MELLTDNTTTAQIPTFKKRENKRDARRRRKEQEKQSSSTSMPYKTFITTETHTSVLGPCAGDGLIAVHDVPAFTWIGFYPGKITTRRNRKRDSHTMGTTMSPQTFIVADPSIKTGVHMINEASPAYPANTCYIKVDNSPIVLYFTLTALNAGTELLTCYSRNYGKRKYATSRKCNDPRCNINKSGKHRTSSSALEEWYDQLEVTRPHGNEVTLR